LAELSDEQIDFCDKCDRATDLFGIGNREQTYDVSQVQRATRRQAGTGRAEIPATPRMSRAWLAARENNADPDALSQRPPELVTRTAQIPACQQ
jgi:hypothetical protein